MWACFIFPFQNKYDQNAGTWWSRLFMAHFTTLKGWLKKFHISEIVFWQMHKLQIHKLVSRRDHLNVSTMYSIFDWKEFEILSYRQAFLQSTEIRASEEPNALKKAPVQFLPLRKLSWKVPVQFMPFWKLSRKCHFLIRFCTSNWSETYSLKQLQENFLDVSAANNTA